MHPISTARSINKINMKKRLTKFRKYGIIRARPVNWQNKAFAMRGQIYFIQKEKEKNEQQENHKKCLSK
jgi:hypothetical protein